MVPVRRFKAILHRFLVETMSWVSFWYLRVHPACNYDSFTVCIFNLLISLFTLELCGTSLLFCTCAARMVFEIHYIRSHEDKVTTELCVLVSLHMPILAAVMPKSRNVLIYLLCYNLCFNRLFCNSTWGLCRAALLQWKYSSDWSCHGSLIADSTTNYTLYTKSIHKKESEEADVREPFLSRKLAH